MQFIKHSNKSLISNKSLLFNKNETKISCLNNKQKDLLNINQNNNKITALLIDITVYARRKSRYNHA